MPPDLFLLLILGGLFGLLIYSSSRTRKRAQKAAAELRANLVPGQQVMTGSGLFGTVVEVDEEAVVLETSPGVTSRWILAAVSKLVEVPVTGEDEDEEYEDDDEYDDEYEDDEEYEDEDVEDVEDDDEPADAELEVDVPDDVSSLTTDPGEDDAPRR